MSQRRLTGPRLPHVLREQFVSPRDIGRRRPPRRPRETHASASRGHLSGRAAAREDLNDDFDLSDDEQGDDDEKEEEQSTADVKRKRSAEDDASAGKRKKSRKEEEDDEEIAALEKKLGIKSKKLPQSFGDDGLGDLLGDLDDAAEGSGGPSAEDKEWLERKRGRMDAASARQDEDEDEDADEEEDEEEDGDGLDDDSGFHEELDDEDVRTQAKTGPRKRENPYVAPVAPSDAPQSKYVPPSMRRPPSTDAEATAVIQRQIQGHLNRLSEANLLPVFNEVEKLFRSNPRQYVTSTLVDLLIALTSDPATLNDPFLILHAAFIAATYRVIGPDFGAHFLDSFVQRFDVCYKQALGSNSEQVASNKSTVNLISLLSQLYNLQVVGRDIMFDYIRLFLDSISDTHTELVLRVVRSSGPQLRQDDPSSLKDIVSILQRKIAEVGESKVSVRTRFMVETLQSLKDNKMKHDAAGSALMSEHLIRMKKTLGTLNKSNLRATEPLSVSLKDIRDADKRGKWWLVGASWSGNDPRPLRSKQSKPSDSVREDDASDEDLGADISSLARVNHMTTPLRQSIFTALVSASDFRDAQARLQKLRLTNKQSLEIPRVLLQCAGAEAAYNPYYALVARRLCKSDRRMRQAFLFNAWGLYQRMEAGGGASNDDDADAQPVTLRETVNLAKTYAELLAAQALPIALLKHLDLPALPPHSRAAVFAEALLVTTVLRVVTKQRDDAGNREARRRAVDAELIAVFGAGAPDADAGRALQLRWFLERVVARSELAGGRKERRAVRRACETVCRRLGGTAGDGGDDYDDDNDY